MGTSHLMEIIIDDSAFYIDPPDWPQSPSESVYSVAYPEAHERWPQHYEADYRHVPKEVTKYKEWCVDVILQEYRDYPENLDGFTTWELWANPVTILRVDTMPHQPRLPLEATAEEVGAAYKAFYKHIEEHYGGGSIWEAAGYDLDFDLKDNPFTVIGYCLFDQGMCALAGVTYDRATKQYEKCVKVLFC